MNWKTEAQCDPKDPKPFVLGLENKKNTVLQVQNCNNVIILSLFIEMAKPFSPAHANSVSASRGQYGDSRRRVPSHVLAETRDHHLYHTLLQVQWELQFQQRLH